MVNIYISVCPPRHPISHARVDYICYSAKPLRVHQETYNISATSLNLIGFLKDPHSRPDVGIKERKNKTYSFSKETVCCVGGEDAKYVSPLIR